MSITLPPIVGKILIALLAPLNCALIYLIFKVASHPKADGYEIFLITVGVMFSAGQMLLFLELFPDSMQETIPYKWVQFPLFLLIMAGFAFMAIWISLGPGIRDFEFKVEGLIVPLPTPFGEIIGRIAFGLVGILITRSTILYTINQPKELLELQKGKGKTDLEADHDNHEDAK